MALSAKRTADLWYTAWVKAGRPDLPPRRAVIIMLDRADNKADGMAGMIRRARQVRAAFAPDLGDYDAVAFRATGPKNIWMRVIAFAQPIDLASPGAPAGRQLSPERSEAVWRSAFRVMSLSAAADELASSFAVSYTPDLSIGIPEALEALKAYPRATRRLILLSDGLADEKQMEPAKLGAQIRQMGVRLECYALDGQALADEGLNALARGAGARVQAAGKHKPAL
jgi:hypothetical protein